MVALYPSAVLKSYSVFRVANRDGYKFICSLQQKDRNETLLLVVLVEMKKGYVLSYSCESSLFRFLKDVALHMFASFQVKNSAEDLVRRLLFA